MRRFALLLLPLLLLGCLTGAQRAHLRAVATRPIICTKGDDCELRWGRALRWISTNSAWKIRNQSDMLITTEGPFDTPRPAYSLSKTPIGDGTYEITADVWCGNIFGCVPDADEAKASLVDFILGTRMSDQPGEREPSRGSDHRGVRTSTSPTDSFWGTRPR